MEKIKIIYLLGLCQTNKANDNETFFNKIKYLWNCSFSKDFSTSFKNNVLKKINDIKISEDQIDDIINIIKLINIEDIKILNKKIKNLQVKVNINNIEDMYKVLDFINQQQKITDLLKYNIQEIITNIKNKNITNNNEENNINTYIEYLQKNLLNKTHITEKDIKEIEKTQFCITSYNITDINNPEKEINVLMVNLNNNINLYMECIKKD